ncbi:hypothetical protein M3F63_04615 [Brachybacterium muris]|uniref:hypothetical protein n=1 Tax=Brachybacterium muris TaxID=219301 RepID=UPI00223B4B8D|nr:hypothetical protein [Brachybacterium muris]MCT2176953.1 hypothetical protein [Brachybacterium muris]
MVVTARPATAADTDSAGLTDLLPDCWREGNNRRSLVAVDQVGRVLGHCRGIDNDFHPDSRTFVWEILEEEHLGDGSWAEVADALLEAQVEVSTLSLRLKPSVEETELIELCARHSGVLVQLMPPWRYVVDGPLRAWTAEHRSTSDGLVAETAGEARGEEMLDVYVEHYTAQHARWSPAADGPQLRTENAPDFVPGAAGSFDPARSTVLVRTGRIVAQALVWPPEEDGGVEVTVQSRPHEGSTARQDMEACLAAVVERSGDGNVLLIDSHVTEELESAMMRGVPGPPPHPGDTWTAIVGIPVAGGPGPLPLPRDLVPADVADRFAALIR